MAAGFSKFKFSDKFVTLCACAKTALDQMYTLIVNGDITLIELSRLKENEDQVYLLMKAISTDEEMVTFRSKLKQRYHEQNLFNERLNNLRYICEEVTVTVEGTYVRM